MTNMKALEMLGRRGTSLMAMTPFPEVAPTMEAEEERTMMTQIGMISDE